jgi:hypothetical protein
LCGTVRRGLRNGKRKQLREKAFLLQKMAEWGGRSSL